MINQNRIERHTTHPLAKRLRHAFQHGDRPWQGLLVSMALLVLLITLAIGVFLWKDSLKAQLLSGWAFILPGQDVAWNPVDNSFRAWPFIYGTLITSLIAILIAVPISLGVAVFLSELCPAWLREPLGAMVELLAAIPSVVFGLWGIFVFLPVVVTPFGQFLGKTLGVVPGLQLFFSGQIPASGASRLSAGMILAIMIIPTIAAVSRDVFLAAPRAQREASYALGATQWETISKVLIPYSVSGILGAVILGMGRALGETMAVTMVIGNSIEGTFSLLRPGYTLSSIIANEFAEAVSPMHSQALIEVALILFIITLVLNFVARLLVWRVAHRGPQGA